MVAIETQKKLLILELAPLGSIRSLLSSGTVISKVMKHRMAMQVWVIKQKKSNNLTLIFSENSQGSLHCISMLLNKIVKLCMLIVNILLDAQGF